MEARTQARPAPLASIGALLLALGCSLTLGCGADSASDAEVSQGSASEGSYSYPALGLTVSELGGFAASLTHDEDGSITMNGEALVTVDGVGARHVSVIETVAPAAEGGQITLATVDMVTGEERAFHYAPTADAIVVGDLEGGVFVFRNDDGSYDVVTATFEGDPDSDQFEHAADGPAAWQLVQKYKQFTEASPYSLLLAYSLARFKGPEARTWTNCEEPLGCAAGKPGVSAVCRTFATFCDCAACAASGRGDNCELCSLKGS